MRFLLASILALFVLTACASTEPEEVVDPACATENTVEGVKTRLLDDEGIALLADLKGKKNADFLAWVRAQSGKAELPYELTSRTLIFTKVPHPAAMIVMFKDSCRIYALMGPRDQIEGYLQGN